MAAAVYLHNALFTNDNDDGSRRNVQQLPQDQLDHIERRLGGGRNHPDVPDTGAAAGNPLRSSLASPRSRSAPNLANIYPPPTAEPNRSSTSYHHHRRSHRKRWTILRFILGFMLFTWSIYTTVRYWLAYSVFHFDSERRRYSLALGITATIGSGALALDTTFAIVAQIRWLIRRHRQNLKNDNTGLPHPTFGTTTSSGRKRIDSEADSFTPLPSRKSRATSPAGTPRGVQSQLPPSIAAVPAVTSAGPGRPSIDQTQTSRSRTLVSTIATAATTRISDIRRTIRMLVHLLHWFAYLSILLCAAVNVGLVPIWRNAPLSEEQANVYSEHAVAGRCHFDVDVVWSGVSSYANLTIVSSTTGRGPISNCTTPIPWAVFLVGAIFRVVVTLSVVLGFHWVEMGWWRRLNDGPRRSSGRFLIVGTGGAAAAGSEVTMDGKSPRVRPRPSPLNPAAVALDAAGGVGAVGRSMSSPSITTSVSAIHSWTGSGFRSPTSTSPTTTIYSPPVNSQRGSWKRTSGTEGRRSSVTGEGGGRRSSVTNETSRRSLEAVRKSSTAGLEVVPESEASASSSTAHSRRVGREEDARFGEDARRRQRQSIDDQEPEEEEDFQGDKPLLRRSEDSTNYDDDSERTYPERERPASRLSRYENNHGPPSRSSYSSSGAHHGSGPAGRPSFEFGQARVLGTAPRWPDDPNYVDSEEGGFGVTGGTSSGGGRARGAASPASEGHLTPAHTHGLEVRVHTPTSEGGHGEVEDDSSPDQDDATTARERESRQLQNWARDFRRLVDSAQRDEERFALGGGRQPQEDEDPSAPPYLSSSPLTSPNLPPGAAPPSFLSQDPNLNLNPPTATAGTSYQHPLAQGIQLSLGRGEFWDREVRMLGGVVRRMSTIESFGSHERELEANRRGSSGTTNNQSLRRGSGSGGTPTNTENNGGAGGNGAGGDVTGVRTTSPSIMTRTSSRASRRGPLD